MGVAFLSKLLILLMSPRVGTRLMSGRRRATVSLIIMISLRITCRLKVKFTFHISVLTLVVTRLPLFGPDDRPRFLR